VAVPTFYDIDRANARLPELRETLQSLRALRADLVGMRDQIVALVGPQAAAAEAGSPSRPDPAQTEDEARRLHMRMQGVVDQMEAAVARIDAWGIELRDIQTGLVDFPALLAGRQVWLCWRLGEDRVDWWHEVTEGFDARRRLEDLS
jgi:hypothetical protein